MNYLSSFQKQSFLAIFEQKAWAIAHGFSLIMAINVVNFLCFMNSVYFKKFVKRAQH